MEAFRLGRAEILVYAAREADFARIVTLSIAFPPKHLST